MDSHARLRTLLAAEIEQGPIDALRALVGCDDPDENHHTPRDLFSWLELIRVTRFELREQQSRRA